MVFGPANPPKRKIFKKFFLTLSWGLKWHLKWGKQAKFEDSPFFHVIPPTPTASQEKSDLVIPIITLSQNGHIPCSALITTGSPVTLLSEKLQCQLNLPAMPLDSHYHFLGATGDSLTTLETVQVDIVSDHKIWSIPVIAVSSLAHPLFLGLNFHKLTKSKIDFQTNNVKIGSKAYQSDIHCIKSSNFTIIVPTCDVYQPCRLLLNKRACLMVVAALITVIILTAVASHTQCHLKPLFKKQEKLFPPIAHNLTWKELLALRHLCPLHCQVTCHEI